MSGAKEENDKDEEKNIDGEDMDTSELGLSASQVNAAVAAAALKSKEAAGALAPKASEIADAATSTKATKRKEEVHKAAEAEELASNVATEAAKELERYATMPLSEASRIIETKLVDGVREVVIDSEKAPSAKIIGATAYLQTTPRPNPMFGDIPDTFEPENSAQLVSTQVPRLRAALGCKEQRHMLRLALIAGLVVDRVDDLCPNMEILSSPGADDISDFHKSLWENRS